MKWSKRTGKTAHEQYDWWSLLALISVVADYAYNELVPKGVNLEQHVQCP
jgi:hypothetical protein